MAVTFRGSCATQYMLPTPNSDCFVFEVSARAKCKVNILRIVMQFDTLAISTGAGRIMPLIKANKVTGSATGGMILAGKVPWDSTINAPDSGVYLRLDPGFAGGSSSDIVVTGTKKAMAEAFCHRLASGAEQWLAEDSVIVSPMTDAPVVLNPGELLAITWNETSTPIGGVASLLVAWEEDSLGTEYTVGGSVTLAGSPVSGAKVLVVTDLDRDLPAPQLEVLTTGAPGTWSKTLAAGVKASVFVQSRTGETLYTSDGKPFIAKP